MAGDHQSQPFLDWARTVADARKDKVCAKWFDDNGDLSTQRTYQQIWDEAGKISHHLRKKWGVEKGDRVVLCYDFGLHFFEVFFGCLRAGVVAVLGTNVLVWRLVSLKIYSNNNFVLFFHSVSPGTPSLKIAGEAEESN